MDFHIARTAATTGRTLQGLIAAELAETGVADPGGVHVCYGVGHRDGRFVLNGNCSAMNKLQQSQRLLEGLGPGRALAVTHLAEEAMAMLTAGSVLVARDLVHSRGRDIKMALEPWQITPLIQSGSAFFTKYEPSVREFRVWTYRNRHLGTYEKVLRRPVDYKRIGRNHANGFDFSGVESEMVPQALKDLSRDSLRALGLDFGAVDAIQTPDGRYVVLEVNSAPGVSDERRRVVVGLAHRIVRWMANGCPARANEGN